MIDDLQNLKGCPVVIVKGKNDYILAKGVTEKCDQFYKHFLANIKYITDVDIDH